MRFSKAVVKWRVPIVIIAILLMIPATIGMINTRINYDMLDYLPDDDGHGDRSERADGGFRQGRVLDAGDGGYAGQGCCRAEGKDRNRSNTWIRSSGMIRFCDLSVPMQLLPDKIYNEFNTGRRDDDGGLLRFRHERGRDDGRDPRDSRDCRKTVLSFRECPRWLRI